VIDCNEWRTEKRHECANMGKVKWLQLWWQLYSTSLLVWDLENFRPMDFCWHECTYSPVDKNIRKIIWHVPSLYSLSLCVSYPFDCNNGDIMYLPPECRVYFFLHMMMYMPVFSHLRTYTPLLWHHRSELVATDKELYVTEQLTCMSPYSKCQKCSDVNK